MLKRFAPMFRTALALRAVRALPAAALCVALAGPAPMLGAQADGGEMIVIPLGKTVTYNFLSFKLPCPHFINFMVENPSIVGVLGVTETTTKSAFKLQGLAVGVSDVTAAFTGTDPCPGSASPTISVEVTPDEAFTLKQWKTITGSGTKALGGKSKLALADYCDDAEVIGEDYDFFDIDAEEAQIEYFEAAIDALLRLNQDVDDCLADISWQGSSLLGVSGLPEIPDPFSAGSCTSLWEKVRVAEVKAGDAFVKALVKKLKGESKPLAQGGLVAHFRVQDYIAQERASPTDAVNTLDDHVRSARFTLTASYRFGEVLGLSYGGLADATKSQVHVNVSGPDGFTDSRDVDVTAGGGDAWGSFAFTLNTPGLLDPGLYRLDVGYLDDVHPSGTVFQSVP